MRSYICLRKWLVITCLLFVAGWANADNSQLPIEMQTQLLDAEKKVLAAEKSLIEAKIKHQRKEHEVFTKNEHTLFTYTTVALIAGIVIGWLSMMLMARQWVQDRVKDEIDNNIKHLTQIVDNSRLETRLKQSSRLLVLHEQGKSSHLDSTLRNFGFAAVEAEICPAGVNQ